KATASGMMTLAASTSGSWRINSSSRAVKMRPWSVESRPAASAEAGVSRGADSGADLSAMLNRARPFSPSPPEAFIRVDAFGSSALGIATIEALVAAFLARQARLPAFGTVPQALIDEAHDLALGIRHRQLLGRLQEADVDHVVLDHVADRGQER